MLSSLFRALQGSLGVSVTPAHFYFPVPSLKSLEEKKWDACRPCHGLDFHLQAQIERLHNDLLPFAAEWDFHETVTRDRHEFHFNNGFFERVDAEVAYSFVRKLQPKRIIEIGGGNTTLLLAAALARNAAAGAPGTLTCIEPNPAGYLKEGLAGLTLLMEEQVQHVPVDSFRSLQANDILFIDSSHVVSMDNDVLFEVLRILPELAPGVFVHLHDIFTPLDYPRKFVMTNLCFWGEQYLLEAFLAFNASFEVVWASSAMQQFHPEVLRQAFPAWVDSFNRMPEQLKVYAPSLDSKNVWPCSFWMTRTQ